MFLIFMRYRQSLNWYQSGGTSAACIFIVILWKLYIIRITLDSFCLFNACLCKTILLNIIARNCNKAISSYKSHYYNISITINHISHCNSNIEIKIWKFKRLFQYQVSFATVLLYSVEEPVCGYCYNCYRCPTTKINCKNVSISLNNFHLVYKVLFISDNYVL